MYCLALASIDICKGLISLQFMFCSICAGYDLFLNCILLKESKEAISNFVRVTAAEAIDLFYILSEPLQLLKAKKLVYVRVRQRL